MTRSSHLVAVAGLVLVLGLTGCGGGVTAQPQGSIPVVTAEPKPSTQAAASSLTSGAIPAGTAPIEPGTYRIPKSAWSVTDFTVTIPAGWTVQYGHVYLKHYDTNDELGFYAVAPDAIHADACKGGDGELMRVGPSVDDLASALLHQTGPIASRPVHTTLGGYPAIRIDMTVPEGFDLKPCNVADIGLEIWYSRRADKHFVLLRDGIATVYIVDIVGRRQVFLTQHNKAATSDEDVREVQTVLDSIHIDK